MKHNFIIYFLLASSLALFAQEDKKVSLLFAGDLMQHQSQLDGAKVVGGYDYSSYFKYVKDSIERADIAVINFETTLPGKGYTGYPCFGSPDALAYATKEAGFDVFLTANNHCLDKRKQGLQRTILMLDSMQVRHTGTFVNQQKKDLQYPLMLIKNGIRIAMLNYTYGTNGIEVQAPNIVNFINRRKIYADIQSAKFMKPDIIVANMHWGDEYKLNPNKEQKDLAKFLIDNGVRLVIGAHPHVVQPIDIQKENDSITNVIVYSLGNFISGMKAVNTDGGMMVDIQLSKSENGSVSIDTCSYSLVWVHKPLVEKKQQFQLIPVAEYETPEGREFLGTLAYDKMVRFATTARKTIESMWK